MVKVTTRNGRSVQLRSPLVEDAVSIHALIASCPPLDLNSSYAYLLQALHCAQTCVVAEDNGAIAAYLSAYLPNDRFSTLFVWQIAVSAAWRREGLAMLMLREVLARTAACGCLWVETTISPSNDASYYLFHGLARDLGADFQAAQLLEETLFGDEGHESEQVYRLGPLVRARVDGNVMEKGIL